MRTKRISGSLQIMPAKPYVEFPSITCLQVADASDPRFFIEFFCGRAEIAGAFARRGWPCKAFDVQRSATHDLTAPLGVVLGMLCLLSLPVGSAAHLGTVCTSFCWVNSGTHRRSAAFPLGCLEFEYVVDGNHFAAISAPRLKKDLVQRKFKV